MFVYSEACGVTGCEPGVTRKVMGYNDAMMMCEITFETGAKGNVHKHPHTQVTYIAEGKFAFTNRGGDRRGLERGLCADTAGYAPRNGVPGGGEAGGCVLAEKGRLFELKYGKAWFIL